jgi:NAD(P)-dependent dehydrogenase (short-subunit alcohol dehydrogenase family)
MILKSKNCIITGATSGIGRETAIELARQGATLVLPVRNLSKGKELKGEIIDKTGNTNVDIMECDLASFQSIRDFATAFLEKYDKLHILINNAGLWESKHKKSADGIEMTFAVNHLAPFLLTLLLLDVMKRSAPARIVNVSSEAHRSGKMNFNDLEGNKSWNSFKSYGQSKLANILFTRKLAGMLEDENITVNCVHPGVVATKLFDILPKILVKPFSLFMISPAKGAQTSIFLASSPEVENISGEYFKKMKIKKTTAAATNKKAADRLWEISLRMTGLEQSSYEKKTA